MTGFARLDVETALWALVAQGLDRPPVGNLLSGAISASPGFIITGGRLEYSDIFG
jgi:hypothetical protein